MVLSLEQLKDAACDLPAPERVELARFLIQLLDEKQAADIRQAWLTVAEKRMTEVRGGKIAGVPAEEVLKNLLGPQR